ncbi:lipopolysaccharide biosynthesis protein [Stutzerimonas stutzeri]|uniref:lipopolysaccharide biosynthesis protein n=1 Tax=Stutzerimonas stutzeri TaxID=316 RepID=UPI003D31E42A
MQALQLFIRLAEIPLFVGFWGAAGYGEWLMITAIPTALALSDGGFTRTAQREMAMKAARNDSSGVINTFQSTWIMLAALSATLMTIVLTASESIPIHEWLSINSITNQELAITLLILSCQVLVNFQCSLLYGGFSMHGKYATAEIHMIIYFGLGFSSMALTVMAGGSMADAALASLLGGLAAHIIMLYNFRRINPELIYGWKFATRREMKRLALPSFANLAFPLGDAINIQGMRVLVGITLGAESLAAFSALRTLCRMALQPVLAVGRTIEPEISLTFGAGKEDDVRNLLMRGTQLTLWFAIFLCFTLIIIGPTLFTIWTNSKLSFDIASFTILLAASLIASIRTVALTIPCATNRHMSLAANYLATQAVGSTALAYILCTYIGIAGASLSILLIDICIALFTIKTAANLADQPLHAWARFSITPPIPEAIKLVKKLHSKKRQD